MGFISVQSDGVRSGEDAKLDVSKGVLQTPTTAADKLQFLFLTQQKNHRELMGNVGLLETRIKNLEDQILNSTLATHDQISVCDKTIERAIEGIDLVIQFLERPPRPSIWRRIGNALFGREK